jgi:hypothetical protein
MIVTKFFLLFVLTLSLLFNGKGYSQGCQCPQVPTPISETEAEQYKKNYGKNYRNIPLLQKTKVHSQSVDFSKKAIKDFYEKVFISDSDKGFKGINIHFVLYANRILPRQEHDRQIGLMITAADDKCQTDPNELSIMNNSFNQSKSQYDNTPYAITCGKDEYTQYKAYYLNDYPLSDFDHTKYVHYDLNVFEFLYNLLISDEKYRGLRFYFASYNKDDVACGQATAKQITLLITLTLDKGEVASVESIRESYKSNNYLKEKFEEAKFNKLLSILNHGELCPKNCPD